MGKDLVYVKVGVIDAGETFQPLFHLLSEANITFTVTLFCGDTCILKVHGLELPQVQDLIQSGNRYSIIKTSYQLKHLMEKRNEL